MLRILHNTLRCTPTATQHVCHVDVSKIKRIFLVSRRRGRSGPSSVKDVNVDVVDLEVPIMSFKRTHFPYRGRVFDCN